MKARDFVRQLQMEARERGRPIVAWFVVRHCGWLPCAGYHPIEAVVAYPNGDLVHLPSRYGIHSVLFPPPSPHRISSDEAAKIAAKLLILERKAMRNPFLSWSEKLDAAREVE